MSDNYRIICAEKEIDKPELIMSELIAWLQSENIIETEKSDCLLSLDQRGYRPGGNHLSAVCYDENITCLKVCGLESKIGREVFNAMAFTPFVEMYCPNCGMNRFDEITPQAFYEDSLTAEQMNTFHSVFKVFDNWAKHESSELHCPFCNESHDIGTYFIGDEICLSNFGVTFWNWPEFKSEFIEKIQTVIGSKVKVIVGHL